MTRSPNHQAAGDEGRLAGVDQKCPAEHDYYAGMGHGACPFCGTSLESIRADFVAPVVSGEQEKGGVADEGLLDRIIEIFRAELYASHEHGDWTLPIEITGWEDVRPDLRAALSTPVDQSEPVAWRVKDYADGWILFHHEAPARRSAEARNGAVVQPLYALTGEKK